MLSQMVTGTLLYLGYANSLMVQMHWFGLWIILAYIALHLLSQWHFGGAAQLLRIFRPTRLVAASPQFELADLLALLDEQPSPSWHRANLLSRGRREIPAHLRSTVCHAGGNAGTPPCRV